ncbi:hypothetical protein H1220_07165 [Carnobacteriaceae bacterium zg-84]|uniref:hypothetical protein n=1 Tax=Granulicatella sp. zg-84 TaxID=2678503 RepID=UPI0013C09365|nr:hypothetical protein [Granulicatella sp. zg-84]NEW66521.1 hypothetical protein [Granulicatella sp. zg-84]QMI85491.1 hypothetical protein H1220_07165 [Carnobacteriaceae bacterium zg-84]
MTKTSKILSVAFAASAILTPLATATQTYAAGTTYEYKGTFSKVKYETDGIFDSFEEAEAFAKKVQEYYGTLVGKYGVAHATAMPALPSTTKYMVSGDIDFPLHRGDVEAEIKARLEGYANHIIAMSTEFKASLAKAEEPKRNHSVGEPALAEEKLKANVTENGVNAVVNENLKAEKPTLSQSEAEEPKRNHSVGEPALAEEKLKANVTENGVNAVVNENLKAEKPTLSQSEAEEPKRNHSVGEPALAEEKLKANVTEKGVNAVVNENLKAEKPTLSQSEAEKMTKERKGKYTIKSTEPAKSKNISKPDEKSTVTSKGTLPKTSAVRGSRPFVEVVVEVSLVIIGVVVGLKKKVFK